VERTVDKTNKANKEKDYIVTKSANIAGVFLVKGTPVKLSSITAQTYLSQGKIKPATVKAAIKAKQASGAK
jgi:hypothetical protein